MVEATVEMGVAGWVRNRRDGTVEALVQGEPSAIDANIAWCQRGPPVARVDGVDVSAVAADIALVGFTHRSTA
jgi:acylphosphatase